MKNRKADKQKLINNSIETEDEWKNKTKAFTKQLGSSNGQARNIFL